MAGSQYSTVYSFQMQCFKIAKEAVAATEPSEFSEFKKEWEDKVNSCLNIIGLELTKRKDGSNRYKLQNIYK